MCKKMISPGVAIFFVHLVSLKYQLVSCRGDKFKSHSDNVHVYFHKMKISPNPGRKAERPSEHLGHGFSSIITSGP